MNQLENHGVFAGIAGSGNYPLLKYFYAVITVILPSRLSPLSGHILVQPCWILKSSTRASQSKQYSSDSSIHSYTQTWAKANNIPGRLLVL